MKEDDHLEAKREILSKLDRIDGFYRNKDAVVRLDQRCLKDPSDRKIFAPLLFIGDYEEEMKTYAEVIGRMLFLDGVLASERVQTMKIEELDWIIEARDEFDDDRYDRAGFSRDAYDRIVDDTSSPFGILYLENSDQLFTGYDDFERFPIVSTLYGIAEEKLGFLTIFAGKLEGMRNLFLCVDGSDLYDPKERLWFDDISRYWK